VYIFRTIYQYFEENFFSSALNENYENLNFTRTATTLLMLVGGLSLGILIACCISVFERRVVGKFVRGIIQKGAHDPENAVSLADLGMENNAFVKREMSRASISRKLVSIVDEEGRVRDYETELIEAFPEFAAEIAEERGEEFAEKAASMKAPAPEDANVTGDAALLPDFDREDADEKAKKVKKPFFAKKFKPKAVDFSKARFFIPEKLRHRAELRMREKGSSPWVLVIAFVLVTLFFFLALRFIPAFVNMLDVSIGNIKGK
jgi:hypothetical protein